jgi:DNA ligase 1
VIPALEFDPREWLMSEKLDGWFARFDGSKFTTANGSAINAPAWFSTGLPARELRGELFAGVGKFDDVGRIVRSGRG